MKFIIPTEDFLKTLQLVNSVIINKPIISILENFLLEFKNKKIKITASDGETTLQSTLNLKRSNEELTILIQAKLLINVIKTFKNEILIFIVKNNILKIIDKENNYCINLENPKLYPSLNIVNNIFNFKIQGSLLSKIISNTLFAAGNDAIRPIMNGVLIQLESDECNIVATDSHRLVKYTIKNIHSEKKIEFIMSKKPLILLKNSLINMSEFIDIEFDQINIQFKSINTIWTCRLIDGKYPNYKIVIPNNNNNILYIKTSLLVNSVKRVSLFANKSTNQIIFNIKNNLLQILAEDVNFNNKADMKITCKYSGEELNISFNVKFFLEMISNINTDNLIMKMSKSNAPVIIKPVLDFKSNEDILMLIMPLMI